MKKVKIYESEIKRAVRRKLMENILNEEMPSQQDIEDRTDAIENLTTQYKELQTVMDTMKENSEEIGEDEELINDAITKNLSIKEDEDWIQDMADDIKKDGTEGTFREWCKSKNDNWNGCSTECWDAAMATNSKSLHMKVAGAKAFCKRLKK